MRRGSDLRYRAYVCNKRLFRFLILNFSENFSVVTKIVADLEEESSLYLNFKEINEKNNYILVVVIVMRMEVKVSEM